MNSFVEPVVVDVWASNIDKEMAVIRDLVESYPFVAMVLTWY